VPNKFLITSLFALFFCFSTIAQEKKTKKQKPKKEVVLDSLATINEPINPLSPAKAAFYSAVLPGLGQAYNKRYWKIPLVWGAMGASIYFYVRNDKQFDRYRDAYKRRLAGFKDDEFSDENGNPLISDDGLIRAQQQFRRNKEVSLLVTLLFYSLNIIDANVDAHLLQFNVDENLSLSPHYKYNQLENTTDLGLTLNFKF